MIDNLQPGMHVHMMGIGGTGISALAGLMHQMGYVVTGCDLYESTLIPPLREAGIEVAIGHDPAHLDHFAPQVLVISSAVPEDNAEVQAALAQGIPVLKRQDVLGALMEGQYGIAVAGTHGKTSTTAMIAYLLDELGFDPSFIIGGVSLNLETNARAGQGGYFVVEADEYDHMFLGLRPQVIVLTSLEMDHPDMFEDFDGVRQAFIDFLSLLPENGLLIANYDDPEVKALGGQMAEQGYRVQGYGATGAGEWMAMAALAESNAIGGQDFRIFRNQSVSNTTAISRTYTASLAVPGTHNMLNGLAALVALVEIGVKPKEVLAMLSKFSGVKRRFEIKGEPGGVLIIDDYAHHPTEIQAVLQAARSILGDRPIWAVWQPHTFSRTYTLLDEFAASFGDASHVVITDVFRSRDTDDFGVSPQSVLDRIDHPDALHVPGDMPDVTAFLVENVQFGDVVIVMSAGNATEVTDQLLDALR